MSETEKAGVESKTCRRIGLGAVFFIADNGATDGGELDADLMAAAGLKGEFNQRESLPLGEHPIMGHSVAGEGG